MDEVYYTTGAYIYKKQMFDGIWRWVVGNFEEDTFCDGEFVQVVETSDTEDGLVIDE